MRLIPCNKDRQVCTCLIASTTKLLRRGPHLVGHLAGSEGCLVKLHFTHALMPALLWSFHFNADAANSCLIVSAVPTISCHPAVWMPKNQSFSSYTLSYTNSGCITVHDVTVLCCLYMLQDSLGLVSIIRAVLARGHASTAMQHLIGRTGCLHCFCRPGLFRHLLQS